MFSVLLFLAHLHPLQPRSENHTVRETVFLTHGSVAGLETAPSLMATGPVLVLQSPEKIPNSPLKNTLCLFSTQVLHNKQKCLGGKLLRIRNTDLMFTSLIGVFSTWWLSRMTAFSDLALLFE